MTPKTETVYFALNQGGLGDQIARMSVFEYAKKNYPWVDIRIVVPDYIREFYRHHFPTLRIDTFDDLNKVNRQVPINVISADIPQCSIIRQHLVQHAFSTLLDVTPTEPSAYNYVNLDLTSVDISKFDLPTKYAVMTTMATVEVREMSKNTTIGIESYLKSRGIEIVLLGKESASAGSKHKIVASGSKPETSINLLNKTNLLEATKIMSNALVVIGIDNGLLHVAATTDVPIVAGFTTVDPGHRVPQRHNVSGWKFKSVIPDPSLECRFCQSKFNFVYDVDFRKCVEGHLKCVNEMNILPWLYAIEDAISNDYEQTTYYK